MSTLEERIAELMKATGWTTAKVAEVANVSSSAVSQWMGRGKSTQKISNVAAAFRLQAASGFSALWLAEGEGPKMANGPLIANEPGWPLDLVSVHRYTALSPAQRYAAQAAMLQKIEEAESAQPGKRHSAQDGAPKSIDSSTAHESPIRGKNSLAG